MGWQCVVIENIYTTWPPQEGLEIFRGWGSKTKTFEEMYEVKLEFTEGWGFLSKTSFPWGRYRYIYVMELQSACREQDSNPVL